MSQHGFESWRSCHGRDAEGEPVKEITLVDDVPLSHKVAMSDMQAEKTCHRIWPANR